MNTLNLENKEEVQQEFNDLIAVCESQKLMLQDSATKIKEANEHIVELTNSAVGLSDSLKAIHVVLGARAHLFKKDKEMQQVLNSLATFVLSSTAIKLGAISNDKNN